MVGLPKARAAGPGVTQAARSNFALAENSVAGELAELSGLLKSTPAHDARFMAWRDSLERLQNNFPQTIGGRMYNLAPNAPQKVFMLDNGSVVTRAANQPDTWPKGAQLLNKSREDVVGMMPEAPKAPTTQTTKGPWGSTEKPIEQAAQGPAQTVPSLNPPAVAEEAARQARRANQREAQVLMGGASPTIGAVGASGMALATHGREGDGSQGAYQPPMFDPASGYPAPASFPDIPDRRDAIQPGYHSDRAEEGPRMPYGDTMPKDYHSDRAEEGPGYNSTIQRALEVAKRRPAPAAAADQVQKSPAAQSGMLHSLIRGRFGEAGAGSPMDDRLTALQQARDLQDTGRASGGEVNGKGGKDAAIHKALEIIHHLISNR